MNPALTVPQKVCATVTIEKREIPLSCKDLSCNAVKYCLVPLYLNLYFKGRPPSTGIMEPVVNVKT
jgi:hypothetical protein